MIFFIGIKGAGMAALACILQEMGHEVEGSDLETHFFTETSLHDHDIPIHPLDYLPNTHATIIVGNAFKDDFDAVQRARAHPQYQIYRYHEYLGLLTQQIPTIAITGSHGKTTTTKMMSALMTQTHRTGYLIGDGHGYMPEKAEVFVIEADEYRRFFHHYHPEYAVITNIDYDHVDYYKSPEDYLNAYDEFAQKVSKGLWVFADDVEVKKMKKIATMFTYGLEAGHDLVAYDLIEEPTQTSFSLRYLGQAIGRINLPFSGRHLVWNALGCIGIALQKNISLTDIEQGLSRYQNAARRFIVEDFGENVYIDDYAHHPTEVKVTIDAARLRFPHHKLIAIFKPHRVSRLYHFAQAFADALDRADEVYLCGFSAIDDAEEGYDITIDHLCQKSQKAQVITEDQEAAVYLSSRGPACYLFMSSKDIYGLTDLLKRYQNH
jgi:UDP-N-acetylmuramate--alanine ligase